MDRVNVGLTPEGETCLKAVMDAGWFELELDAYRASIALALAADVSTATPLSGVTNKFNVGSLDRDGKLRALLNVMRPDTERPYEASERLADAGVRVLKQKLVDDGVSMSDILGPVVAEDQ